MIVLLSIGEALLAQARDEKLVGGGTITVLPEGIDVEVMKTGGLGGMFFSIDHARFIYRQLLAAPRLARGRRGGGAADRGQAAVSRALPTAARCRCSRAARFRRATTAVGADAAAGRRASGRDDGARSRWRDPTLNELRNEIDHFHLPPAEARGDPTWAEWHYFNVLSPDRSAVGVHLVHRRRARCRAGSGAARCSSRCTSRAARRAASSRTFRRRDVRFSTIDAPISRSATSSVTCSTTGAMRCARAREDGRARTVEVNLVVAPAPGAYFPGARARERRNRLGLRRARAARRRDRHRSASSGDGASGTTTRRRITITTGACGAA